MSIGWASRGPGSGLGSPTPGFPSRQAVGLGRAPAQGRLPACRVCEPKLNPPLQCAEAGSASSCDSCTPPPEGAGSAEEGLGLCTTSPVQSLTMRFGPHAVSSAPSAFPDPTAFPCFTRRAFFVLPRLDRLVLSALLQRLLSGRGQGEETGIKARLQPGDLQCFPVSVDSALPLLRHSGPLLETRSILRQLGNGEEEAGKSAALGPALNQSHPFGNTSMSP